MKKTKKINIYSLTRLHTIAFAFVGLIAGILYGGGGLMYDALNSSLGHGTLLALLAIPIMPIIFGAAGLVIGLVEGVLLHTLRKWLSWIDFDIT